jgi:outer membrane protein OmpA-like peptidoglycan-associated protein
MKYCQSLLFLFLCSSVFGQLNGSWQGVLIQGNPDGSTTNFAIWLDLFVDGPRIKGSIRSEQANTPYYKISSIIGKVEGNNILVKEKIIVNEDTQEGMGWCLLLAKFVYNESEQKLKGTYTSDTEGCVPGELVLVKSNKAFNREATEIIEASSLEEVEALLGEEIAVVGKQFVLTDVKFQSGKHNIASSSYSYLNKIVRLLKENSSIKIHLKGHTDSDGDDENNFILSQKRAKSVSEYLEKKGVNEDMVTYEGYGESRSIATNESKPGKQLNRRVELLIVAE